MYTDANDAENAKAEDGVAEESGVSRRDVLMPENGIVISTHDATELGLEHGDEVKVVSATNPEGVWDLGNGHKKEMLGKVIVTEAIRPGVVSFALGFGNWATGSSDVTIDGKTIIGDPWRGRGIHANAAVEDVLPPRRRIEQTNDFTYLANWQNFKV